MVRMKDSSRRAIKRRMKRRRFKRISIQLKPSMRGSAGRGSYAKGSYSKSSYGKFKQPVVVPVPVPEPVVVPVRTAPRRQILLCPGPVNLTPHVKSALAGPDICHREKEFSSLLQSTRLKLVHALGLGDRYTACLINGSGTAALEAAIMSCVEPGKKLLVVNNGVYGSRLAQLARIYQIPLLEVRSPLTETLDLARVAAVLKRESSIGTVAVVHHETSTGMLNPVEEIGILAKKYRKRFLVDAISSLGAEKLDFTKAHVGFCVGSAGKALHGAPGLSFVLLSQEEVARVVKLKPRALYLNLGLQLRAQESGEPLFTPAVPLYMAFHAALEELIREGIKGRIVKYQQRSVFLRQGFKKLGLKFLLDEKQMCHSLTAMWMPPGKSYDAVHNALRKQGFVIYAGQSELKGKIIRIAHMGQLFQGDLAELLKAMKAVLTES